MRRLTIDEVRATLPDVEELRPVFDHLLAHSEPDRARAWSGSGALGTVGARLVEGDSAEQQAGALAEEEARTLAAVYERAARALSALAAEDRAAAADALLSIAELEEQRDRPGKAEAYAAAAFHTARGDKNQRPAALALRRWARASRAQGKLSEALARYARAHDAALALRDPRGAAEAAIGAGNVLEEQGRWDEAALWYRRALTVVDAVPDAPERWHALLNLAIVSRSSGDLTGGEARLREAAVAAGADPAAPPAIGNAQGQLAMARGAFHEAEEHFRTALDRAAGARARVTIRLNLAECLLAQGRSLEATEHAREAERDAIRARLLPKLPEAYRLLGRIAAAEGNADAFVFFERALEIVRDRGLPALDEAVTLQAYAECERLRGEDEAARDLLGRAAARFEALGLPQMRQPWVDVYADAKAPEPHPDRDEDHHEE